MSQQYSVISYCVKTQDEILGINHFLIWKEGAGIFLTKNKIVSCVVNLILKDPPSSIYALMTSIQRRQNSLNKNSQTPLQFQILVPYNLENGRKVSRHGEELVIGHSNIYLSHAYHTV